MTISSQEELDHAFVYQSVCRAFARPREPGSIHRRSSGRTARARACYAAAERATADGSELRAAPGVQIIQIQPTRTVPWGTLQAFNAAMMQGWTPVTNGATQGGAAVFKSEPDTGSWCGPGIRACMKRPSTS
ncbi:MAG: hypothetical protein HZY74_01570 [Brevundimonas sp.]|nr:MAG: hypothetical protein HZY74_01570 [Brevundimonas sp.]